MVLRGRRGASGRAARQTVRRAILREAVVEAFRGGAANRERRGEQAEARQHAGQAPGQPVVSRWRRRRSVVLVKLISATLLTKSPCTPRLRPEQSRTPSATLHQLIGAAAARPTRAQVTACDTRCPDHQAYRRVRPACCVPPCHSVTLPAALTTKRAGACAPVACRLAPQHT